jgi:hypothetical protein
VVGKTWKVGMLEGKLWEKGKEGTEDCREEKNTERKDMEGRREEVEGLKDAKKNL